ncbi:precorrin-8X methylmutase [Vibrio sp. LaRot3]|uniref:precorrin-8X methylmutase n=1 Tax=Vibrio sp. LaRot3 TaxID=2998829 RepID=UPI0022CE1111|nr:precorrin-8X methylmutase [Vibrio sp. LaRot3]MDA0149602.1 precorrin-8X methylmutase [Vibrio sp. LaRot3]
MTTDTELVMQQMTAQGRAIESGSFAIIDDEIERIHGGHGFTPSQWNIVRRAIHTTGDFEFKQLFKFSEKATEQGLVALKSGALIISDVSMIVSGLNKKRLAVNSNEAVCFVSHPEVIARAKQSGRTRSLEAMRYCAEQGLLEGAILAVGNAPTALIEALEIAKEGGPEPALIIGIPVGFVMAEESKQMLTETDIPYITSLGRKGGSPLVVSTIHALLTEAL